MGKEGEIQYEYKIDNRKRGSAVAGAAFLLPSHCSLTPRSASATQVTCNQAFFLLFRVPPTLPHKKKERLIAAVNTQAILFQISIEHKLTLQQKCYSSQ